jgi:hypothetical protein
MIQSFRLTGQLHRGQLAGGDHSAHGRDADVEQLRDIIDTEQIMCCAFLSNDRHTRRTLPPHERI